ncbi:MAG: ABC transporter ATP-binding protein/permease [Corynebacterium sp.]|uniref:ABC transporter ATP-binding protein n=3 Tax=Corynebacteriaceae TaxID=1653 RepID=UPI0026484A5D|nr:ABC transporter ATP-binding protein [Corynebacterium sp.]MDN5721853.1 ABC transporter ATP-binding protein/permease [Corynebacterium sp.]MDN6283167.1 ABC transporter ATP-binding protein/permease [Corynebacterium sp.]MDN6304274.1 ABC transporter ATP-binding protein/permease [Corynebacterium sp.]MDN6352634.1 ABC transporter ATP-binding protein/permease [Corynebacterium sp.]MDN6366397.1 ABC transporter ATP-binding protein/permease [Corynebacterium sp.]
MRELWPYYVMVILAATVTVLLSMASPFLIKHATDTIVDTVNGSVTVEDATTVVIAVAVGLLLAELAHTVIHNIGGWFGDVMGMRMRQILSNRYFAKLLSLPQGYFDKQITGTIISRLDRSILGLTQFLQAFANNFFSMILTVIVVLAISAWYYWPLALLLVIIFPMYLWLTALTSKRWMRWEKTKNDHVDAAQGRFAEVIGQVKVVKSFVSELRELRLFQQHFAETVSVTKEQSRWWHMMDIFRMAGMNVVFFAIYLVLFLQTLNGNFTIGDMVLLVQLVAMAKQPATMMSWMVDSAQRAAAGSREYFEAMEELEEATVSPVLLAASREYGPSVIPEQDVRDAIPDPPAPLEGCSRPGGTPVVEFENVTFGYDVDDPVIHDVSLTAGFNEKVALVGESGGGKSTLVNLLLGLYRPSSGTLRVCGHDIAELSAAQLRGMVGVVFQDAALFSGTIRENIAYGRPDASDAEIEDAARRANADGFIRAFPQGYDTVIGERGLRLSGGQKQRVAVARAMLKDAPILVLDEATSALDTRAERAVQAGLEELMVGRTTLVIAHRLSTIASVDTIVTLSEGRVDEIGTPAELAVSGGIYGELLRLTASSSAEDRKRLRSFGFHGDGDEGDEE